MTNFELSILMGLLPIFYFLIFTRMDRKIFSGQRITTNQLERKGELLTVTNSHSFIKFDDGAMDWYRNEMFREDSNV
jgi:hypothetical protein